MSAGDDPWLRRLDSSDGHILAMALSLGTTGLAFTSDGRTLATIAGRELKLWDTAAGELAIKPFAGLEANIVSIAVVRRTGSRSPKTS